MWEGDRRQGAGDRLLCSPLMFDLEPCAKCSCLLQNVLICQAVSTPALGQPGWGEGARRREMACQWEVGGLPCSVPWCGL